MRLRTTTVQDKDREIKVIGKLKNSLDSITLCKYCRFYKPGKDDNCGFAVEVEELQSKGIITPIVGCVEFEVSE